MKVMVMVIVMVTVMCVGEENCEVGDVNDDDDDDSDGDGDGDGDGDAKSFLIASFSRGAIIYRLASLAASEVHRQRLQHKVDDHDDEVNDE
jgi:hypothetical protein